MKTSVHKTLSNMEDQLKLWGAKLEVLTSKADVAGQKAKIGSRKHLDELKAKMNVAQAKLRNAKAAGDEKWDAFKADVESSWKELESAFKKLSH